MYPSPLCWGASFDPELVEQMAAQIGPVHAAAGVHQGLAPVLDVLRLALGPDRGDDRRGPLPGRHDRQRRTSAGWSRPGIVATLKHFAGYSASRAGRNMAPA